MKTRYRHMEFSPYADKHTWSCYDKKTKHCWGHLGRDGDEWTFSTYGDCDIPLPFLEEIVMFGKKLGEPK